MKFILWRHLAAMMGSVFLAGCGNAEVNTDPFRDVVGREGRLHFQVDAEEPLAQGTNDLIISIFETSTHIAFVGAEVQISATMPAMAHDTPTTALIEERDGGKYLARGLSLPMAGRWLVEVQASRQGTFDSVQITYDLH